MLQAGDTAPDFTARDAQGNEVKLSALRGQDVVLYFYPKDDTEGCTKEACEFRDAFPRFDGARAAVLGVSPDGVKSHAKFKAKYALPFTLLADTEHKLADAYGVYGEKSFAGRNYMGVTRKTFVIDKAGKIKKVFDKVDVEHHADEVLAALRS